MEACHDVDHHHRTDPFIHLGPVALAWHGLTIAIGIFLGGLVAARAARERGLRVEPLYTIGVLLALGGVDRIVAADIAGSAASV